MKDGRHTRKRGRVSLARSGYRAAVTDVSGLRPEVIAFDVIETLASLEVVGARLEQLGQPADLLHRWFIRLLRDGMALTAAGDFQPFAAVAASALRAETVDVLSDDDVQHAVTGFTQLTPQPDAVDAVRAAREAGFRVITVSNGAASSTRGFLDRAGIAGDVEDVVSIEDARAWKPSPEPYRLAAQRADVPIERMALVAVHSWDVYGARRVGCTTGWCPRLEGVPSPVFGEATVTAASLTGVVAGLAALPEG